MSSIFRKEVKSLDTAQEWEPIDPGDVSGPNGTAQSVTETWLAETAGDPSSKPVHLLHVTSGEQTKFQIIKEKSSYVVSHFIRFR